MISTNECLSIPNTPGAYRLYLGTDVVYVGSSDNLRSRIIEHVTREANPLIVSCGWTQVAWQQTGSANSARALEWSWYITQVPRPRCNRISPPEPSIATLLGLPGYA
jgi:excinuclease UvrABC nuclease subunit